MRKLSLACGLAIALAGIVSWMGMYQGGNAAATTGVMSVAELETVNLYDVRGQTLDELRRDVFSRGPFDRIKRQRFAGWTSWQIKWWLDHETDDTACSVTAARTETHVTYTLPQWSEEDHAPADLQRAWRRFITSLIEHEQGHGQLARELGDRIRIAIEQLPPHPDCGELERQANALAHAMIRDDRTQEAYDLQTGHGERQGAAFPRLLVRAP
jgi:predicted secreted Zn-dependent protease